MADLPTEATQLAIAVAEQCRALRTLINGNALDLRSLDTTAKGSLVDAINEIFAMGGGGGGTELTNYSQIADLTGYPASFPPTIGSGANQAVAGNDARLIDSRAPTAHKSTHATGGADALAPSDIGAIPATGGTMTNGTIGGTLTINSTTYAFGTGAAAALVGKLVEVYTESTTGALTINSTNAATYNGKMVLFSGASAHTVTFEDSIPAGFNFAWQQTGAGQVTFAGSGVTVRSYASLVKSAGQWATGSLVKTASGELALGGTLA